MTVQLNRGAFKKLGHTKHLPSCIRYQNPACTCSSVPGELLTKRVTMPVLPYHHSQRALPGPGGCTTDTNRSKIMAIWSATGNSRYNVLLFTNRVLYRSKKHFRCSTLISHWSLFETASASHREIKSYLLALQYLFSLKQWEYYLRMSLLATFQSHSVTDFF